MTATRGWPRHRGHLGEQASLEDACCMCRVVPLGVIMKRDEPPSEALLPDRRACSQSVALPLATGVAHRMQQTETKNRAGRAQVGDKLAPKQTKRAVRKVRGTRKRLGSARDASH